MLLNKEILINRDCLLIEIQRAFTAFYPYLKIEFIANYDGVNATRCATIDPRTPLKQLSKLNEQLTLNINIERTVIMVSEDFKRMLGLVVQVSRKSGNIWNTISFTDGWTLEAQNTAGEFVSSIMRSPT